ncbi:MAG: O-antigen ligase family protein [Pirellulales bacterium]
MFVSFTILCFALIAAATVINGPRHAAALAFGLAMVLPNWIVREIGAILFDLRMVCALAAMTCLAMHGSTRWRLRFVWVDAVLAALVVTQLTTEALFANPTATQLVDNAVQWLIPYIFGRIVWQTADDGERLLPIVAVCCAVLGVWSAFESITRINPVQLAFGYVGSLQGQTDFRWGLKRADGPLMHPIFFGMQMVLLMPFALEAARRAKAGVGPNWWRRLPWITAAGAFFSMSRGPQMALIGTVALTAAILKPKWRIPVAVPLVVFVLGVASAPDAAVDFMQRWSGEEATMSIDIRGEYYPYTGTMHRLLQVRVYEEALYNAGWLGYGSAAMGMGTTKIPFVEDHLRQMFSSIDNHYLQFTLQNGFSGLLLFLAFCFFGIGYALRALKLRRDEFPSLAAGMAAALTSVTVLVWSVWLASDLRFPLLALVGMSACMWRPRTAATADELQTMATSPVADSVPVAVLRRLVPGHPHHRPA